MSPAQRVLGYLRPYAARYGAGVGCLALATGSSHGGGWMSPGLLLGTAVNLASPRPVTQAEFARTLGRVLGRPTVLAMPAFAVRLMFGEMAGELLLASQRAEPAAFFRPATSSASLSWKPPFVPFWRGVDRGRAQLEGSMGPALVPVQ